MSGASEEMVSLEQLMPELKTNRAGVCIRGGRVKVGLTQVQLAGLIGIPLTQLYAMECGKVAVTAEVAEKLAAALKLDRRVFLPSQD